MIQDDTAVNATQHGYGITRPNNVVHSALPGGVYGAEYTYVIFAF